MNQIEQLQLFIKMLLSKLLNDFDWEELESEIEQAKEADALPELMLLQTNPKRPEQLSDLFKGLDDTTQVQVLDVLMALARKCIEEKQSEKGAIYIDRIAHLNKFSRSINFTFINDFNHLQLQYQSL